MCTLSFLAKNKKQVKQKNYFLLLFHSTTAAVRTQGWDGQTDGGRTDRQTINPAWITVEILLGNNRAWIPVEILLGNNNNNT